MSTPYLRRYDTTVLRDKSQTDSAQVPADASIAIYREGATVTAQTPISPGTPAAVPVSDLGSFAVGDAILVDGNDSKLDHFCNQYRPTDYANCLDN